MNPTTEPTTGAQPQLLPPLPPLQPHRPSTSCDRHPEEHFTGFCPSCLCERLAVLDANSSAASSSSTRKLPTSSAAATALRAIFRPSGGGNTSSRSNRPPTSSSSLLPELRRTKSFSASKNEGLSGVFEPQRKSCDVRVRSTLWNLFNQDDGRNPLKKEASRVGGAGTSGGSEFQVDSRNLASSSSVQGPVFESKEEEQSENEEEEEGDEEEVEDEDNGGEVMVLNEELNVGNVVEDRVPEILEEEEPERTMKDHIDLDSQSKKASGRDFKEIAGSFWSAASVFSKKLQKWRQKQKMKKRRNGGGLATLPVEKPIGKQFRDTQSEIADYGYGRRSCDTDPRFSLDAGRISFDNPRYSFDEPRASWDGYLLGRTFPRMPTMLSVVEDAPVRVQRYDNQIPVEESMNAINEDETVPGGSTQTREYYTDSSSKRRKSLDRSSSISKTAAAVVVELDELKPVANANSNPIANSNGKVTPATVDYIHGQKMVLPDRDLKDSNSNSLRDDCSETFDMNSRDNASVIGNGDRKESKKSSFWIKALNIWGFIHRRGSNKDEDEENRYTRANGVERSLSESWQDSRSSFNRNVFRSNSSVSWRNAQSIGGGSFASVSKNGVQANNGNGKMAKDERVLEGSRSARYSPNNIDNGLFRLYLGPLRGSRRKGTGKTMPNQVHNIARSVLRLY